MTVRDTVVARSVFWAALWSDGRVSRPSQRGASCLSDLNPSAGAFRDWDGAAYNARMAARRLAAFNGDEPPKGLIRPTPRALNAVRPMECVKSPHSYPSRRAARALIPRTSSTSRHRKLAISLRAGIIPPRIRSFAKSARSMSDHGLPC
jgi:hypothetical protein